MTETVWLALIAALSGMVTSVIAPVVIAIITARNHRLEKKEDWRRQDALASKAAEASRAVLASNKDLHRVSQGNSAKLDKAAELGSVIHTLVNSNLTKAKKNELLALKAQARVMEEMKDLRRALTPPVEITTAGQTELNNIYTQIQRLEAQLVDRSEADMVLAQEQEVSK